jgi:hypothetical protein
VFIQARDLVTKNIELFIFDDFSQQKRSKIIYLDDVAKNLSFIDSRAKDVALEELRLFYVAMTRSKGDIYLIKNNKPNIYKLSELLLAISGEKQDELLLYLQQIMTQDLNKNLNYDKLYNFYINLNISINILKLQSEVSCFFLSKVRVEFSEKEKEELFNADEAFAEGYDLDDTLKIHSYGDILTKKD